jgi:thymidylate synthase (FAD)
MKIIPQSVTLYQPKPAAEVYQSIEDAARISHKSEAEPKRQEAFLKHLLEIGHDSVFEHESISVEIITDRGIMAELTRHRLASYLIASTRYITYNDPDSFQVIMPSAIRYSTMKDAWKKFMRESEAAYNACLEAGLKPEMARSVLTQAFATKIRMTANIRQWRHIFKLRTAKNAHPQMQELMIMTLQLFADKYPIFFEDIATQ